MLHTSESLLNPFGENDGDIDVDQVIDRYLRISYLIVDEMYAVVPELTQDEYWQVPHDDIYLPYTLATKEISAKHYLIDLFRGTGNSQWYVSPFSHKGNLIKK